MKYFFSFIVCILFSIHVLAQSSMHIDIDPGKRLHTISPAMWGIFFEDINFAADGGLYAELVKNRSFEFDHPMTGWSILTTQGKGKYLVINDAKKPSNGRYMKITTLEGSYGLENEGFRGMGIHANADYIFSYNVRNANQDKLKISIQLLNFKDEVIGESIINSVSKSWKYVESIIHTTDSAEHGKLRFLVTGKGSLDVDMISLFPKNTWKNRAKGLRADIAQLLADLKPGFVRFPGGCIVEGRDLMNRYQWKKTVGDIHQRKTMINRWNTEFKHRSAPDYFQSFGLGFYEYFLFAEDIGAEALPILNCGMACQFNTGEVAHMDDLELYIQDALDLIEFANGRVSTKWGKLRSDMGHPKPFNLKYIGVGNEQWEEQYFERYKIFEKRLLTSYPSIKLVSGTGPFSDGEWFDDAWKKLKDSKAALVDEHYYKPPQWFLNNAKRYDQYPRQGPKIFAGEYAAHAKDYDVSEGRNNWESALAEASFMTGLERNADIVRMASYAPLLAHKDAWQWRPDLIWFDNLTTMTTPNYHVQKLYANNKGHYTLPIMVNGSHVAGQDSVYASAVVDTTSTTLIIKITNAKSLKQSIDFKINGVKNKPADIEYIAQDNKYEYNSFTKPDLIRPMNMQTKSNDGRLIMELLPYSFYVFKMKL